MLLSVKLMLGVSSALFLFSLVGCGEKTVEASGGTKSEQSQACIDCHQSVISPVTGKTIVEEWTLSHHKTSNAAGCADCHEPELGHPTGCNLCHGGTAVGSSTHVSKNPDEDRKCDKCHGAANGLFPTPGTREAHFNNNTSGTYKARYVTKNYERKCRSCHNPHDTTSQINIFRQWARSGKGDVNALPWKNYDFKTRGISTPGATPANSFGTDCVRCHTATGHINYLNTGSIAPFGTSRADGKEVLACNVCHTDYSYARRQMGAVTAYYNKSTVSKMRIRISATYPNIGESNLCLNCHVGRETGRIIKELADPTKTASKLITPSGAYNFANASFENSHYLTAGATIFKTSGFEFYSSHYYSNPSFYDHDKIGVSNFKNTGTSGPCITCHMKPGNHTFMPVVKDQDGNVTALANSATCNNALCHNGSISVTELEHQKEQYNAAMDALKAILQEKLFIYFSNANPYFFTKPYVANYVETGGCLNQPVKNWLTGASTTDPTYNPSTKKCTSTITGGLDGTGPNNMGAAFNYNLLNHDFGAFAHNRYYAKRLIYDSISWLYDNDIKFTSNAQGYSSDVEAAIQNSTQLTAQQISDACNYLFTSRGYTIYVAKDLHNWRPGSDPSSPVY